MTLLRWHQESTRQQVLKSLSKSLTLLDRNDVEKLSPKERENLVYLPLVFACNDDDEDKNDKGSSNDADDGECETKNKKDVCNSEHQTSLESLVVELDKLNKHVSLSNNSNLSSQSIPIPQTIKIAAASKTSVEPTKMNDISTPTIIRQQIQKLRSTSLTYDIPLEVFEFWLDPRKSSMYSAVDNDCFVADARTEVMPQDRAIVARSRSTISPNTQQPILQFLAFLNQKAEQFGCHCECEKKNVNVNTSPNTNATSTESKTETATATANFESNKKEEKSGNFEKVEKNKKDDKGAGNKKKRNAKPKKVDQRLSALIVEFDRLWEPNNTPFYLRQHRYLDESALIEKNLSMKDYRIPLTLCSKSIIWIGKSRVIKHPEHEVNL